VRTSAPGGSDSNWRVCKAGAGGVGDSQLGMDKDDPEQPANAVHNVEMAAAKMSRTRNFDPSHLPRT
jgi:hypothetical protein